MTNELQLKAWVMEEAERDGVSKSAIYMRMKRGRYEGLKLVRVATRTIYVQLDSPVKSLVDPAKRRKERLRTNLI